MIPVYICEDNQEQRENIEDLIRKYIMIEDLDMFVNTSTYDPEKVLKDVIDNKTTGIYFFDIDLNNDKLNGFSLAQEIRKIDSDGYIVFVTTHEEMAFQTFHYKVAALDYIIKDDPIEIEKSIKDCFKTIRNQLGSTDIHKQIFNITSDDKMLFLDEQKITYFEVISSHKIVVHSLEKRINFNGDLKEIEKRLPSNFVRCHRSFIVNLDYIDHIDKTNRLIILKNGSSCYLAKRKLNIVLDKLNVNND